MNTYVCAPRAPSVRSARVSGLLSFGMEPRETRQHLFATGLIKKSIVSANQATETPPSRRSEREESTRIGKHPNDDIRRAKQLGKTADVFIMYACTHAHMTTENKSQKAPPTKKTPHRNCDTHQQHFFSRRLKEDAGVFCFCTAVGHATAPATGLACRLNRSLTHQSWKTGLM